jgi:hypothetical protein
MKARLSFAEQHRMQVLARREQPAVGQPATDLPLARTMRHKLSADRVRLSRIASNLTKAGIKAELVKDYWPYLQGQMAAGGGDEVLTQVMVWAFDAGLIALEFQTLAVYALEHQLALPAEFLRPLHAWVAESVAKWTLAQNGEVDPMAIRIEQLTRTLDMHDQIRAKLHHACARLLESSAPAEALAFYRSADDLDSHSRVKTRIKALEKSLSPSPLGQAGASAPAETASDTPADRTVPPASAQDEADDDAE